LDQEHCLELFKNKWIVHILLVSDTNHLIIVAIS
jgi:hypothetical protein